MALQLSFLNAFLKGNDDAGWSVPGKLPAVNMVLRQGSPTHNDATAELKAFPRRAEMEWPIARTVYQKWHLTSVNTLEQANNNGTDSVISYDAPK